MLVTLEGHQHRLLTLEGHQHTPLCLVSMYETQKNFEVKMRQTAIEHANKRIIYLAPFWNKVYGVSSQSSYIWAKHFSE